MSSKTLNQVKRTGLFLVIICFALESNSCSCIKWPPKQAYNLADFVVKGKVLELSTLVVYDTGLTVVPYVPRQTFISHPVPIHLICYRASMLVSKTFKGNLTSDTVDVYTSDGSCTASFITEREYIIYGHSDLNHSRLQPYEDKLLRSSEYMYTTWCDGTKGYTIEEESALNAIVESKE